MAAMKLLPGSLSANALPLAFPGTFCPKPTSLFLPFPPQNACLRHTSLPVLASIFPFSKKKDKQLLKQELLDAIAPLDRGVDASPDDQLRIEKIAQSLESVNPIKETLKSPLLNGKWELLYTTSESILKKQRPKLLRPGGAIFQAINADTLRAQNLETWPYFNQVTANLTPLSGKKVAVKFDVFKIGGLISVKAPDRARGELEITYLDEELRCWSSRWIMNDFVSRFSIQLSKEDELIRGGSRAHALYHHPHESMLFHSY